MFGKLAIASFLFVWRYNRVMEDLIVGYRVIGNTEDLFNGYLPRAGLEGPFYFDSRGVLYYDPKEGKYWDPKTDFYLSNQETSLLVG